MRKQLWTEDLTNESFVHTSSFTSLNHPKSCEIFLFFIFYITIRTVCHISTVVVIPRGGSSGSKSNLRMDRLYRPQLIESYQRACFPHLLYATVWRVCQIAAVGSFAFWCSTLSGQGYMVLNEPHGPFYEITQNASFSTGSSL